MKKKMVGYKTVMTDSLVEFRQRYRTLTSVKFDEREKKEMLLYVLERVPDASSMLDIFEELGINNKGEFYTWMDLIDGYREKWEVAQRIRGELLFEKIIGISMRLVEADNDIPPASAKVAIDGIKYIISILNKEKFGSGNGSGEKIEGELVNFVRALTNRVLGADGKRAEVVEVSGQ